MQAKTFGVGAAGLVLGLGLAQLLPRDATAPANDTATGATPSATPFACASDGGTAQQEIAKHAGRVTVFVSWSDPWGIPWLPTFERIRSAYAPRGVDIVGVPTGSGKPLDVDALCRDHRLRWPQLRVTLDESWADLFSNRYLVVLDRSGKVVYRGYYDQGVTLAIDDALQDAPRAVSGRVLHRGRPIPNFTDLEPRITIKNALNWTSPPVTIEYFRATGSFTASLVPGTYVTNVEVGRDWFGSTNLGVPDYPAAAPADVELLRRVRLTSPIDSDVPQGKNDEPPPFHPSPVRIAWEPVPGADRYFWNASGDGTSSVSDNTTKTEAIAPLAPGKYTLFVTAYEKDRTIGHVRVQYSSWPADGYTFRVPPK